MPADISCCHNVSYVVRDFLPFDIFVIVFFFVLSAYVSATFTPPHSFLLISCHNKMKLKLGVAKN